MAQYTYNSQFFGKWVDDNPNISRGEILKALETKDYHSLKRWKSGEMMPLKTILRLCNHFNLRIENFISDKAAREATSSNDSPRKDNVQHQNNDNHCNNGEPPTPINVPPAVTDSPAEIAAAYDKSEGTDTYLPTAKRAQLEAQHTKALYQQILSQQQREDNIRAAYESRMDVQQQQHMDIINRQNDTIQKQAEQIAYLSNLISSSGISGYTSMANEPSMRTTQKYEKAQHTFGK